RQQSARPHKGYHPAFANAHKRLERFRFGTDGGAWEERIKESEVRSQESEESSRATPVHSFWLLYSDS
ncbi:MAG: hypothetical protein FWE95_07430, partial [Planctomycetaceae bacterium]|nr:hypothetical protein [Planctomycetaceae bacterium]